MALTPQQLQALYISMSKGNQSDFAAATQGMDQDTRNQYINQYGTGGRNYGDYLKWYGDANNQKALNGNPYNNGGLGAGVQPIGTTPGNPGQGNNQQDVPTPTNGSWDVNKNYAQGLQSGNPYTAPAFTMPGSGAGDPTGWSNPYTMREPMSKVIDPNTKQPLKTPVAPPVGPPTTRTPTFGAAPAPRVPTTPAPAAPTGSSVSNTALRPGSVYHYVRS